MDNQISEFMKLMHSFKRAAFKLQPSSLSSSEFMTMITIHHGCLTKSAKDTEEGMKISDISQMLETSKPDVSKKLKLLEERELVERVNDKKDKRVTYVRLTKKGIAELDKGKNEADQFMTNVFERMGQENTEKFLCLCKKLKEAMEEEFEKKKERDGKEKYEENR